MINRTYVKDFHISAFSNHNDNKPLLVFIFLLMYLIGLLGNAVIITLVYIDIHLNTPMYIFLSNLSFVDICFTTVITPKLLDILLSGNDIIPFIQCFSQMCCYTCLGIVETVLLSFMAYDRYVAVSHPLHYQMIMNNQKCILILGGTWIAGVSNSCIFTYLAAQLTFCYSNHIENFFCEIKALTKIACADMRFYVFLIVETFLFGFLPFMLSLMSYIKIIASILHIKPTTSRSKAFSTCTSHLTVLSLFYGTILGEYWNSPSENLVNLDQVFSVLYTAVTPMLNPLIYSLRNEEVKSALKRAITKNILMIWNNHYDGGAN